MFDRVPLEAKCPTARGSIRLAFAVAAGLGLVAIGPAEAKHTAFDFTINPDTLACGQYDHVQAIVWHGNETRMSLARLAAYCSPVLWFSPDEPLLNEADGEAIRIPTAFPFEERPDRPVVYYRVRNILKLPKASSAPYLPDPADRTQSILDLSQIAGVDLDFFFYYPSEAGLGGHLHDVESAVFQLVVWQRPKCADSRYHLVVTKVTGKAHGLQWYDNTLGIDEWARFPMHLLVEEGKHATCTDKNGDGYYTPNYDVNRRVNDAWAVRDVIRGGTLFTGGYESWMTKVRKPEDRVFPPLPEDSPLRAQFVGQGVYAPGYAVYELRPFPSADRAPHDLVHFIADKGDTNWPQVTTYDGRAQFKRWVGSDSFVKSLSISFYSDGDVGIAAVFPLLIVKNVEAPMVGGFVTNRLIFKDRRWRAGAWMLHYTPSASRWLDTYLSAGVEWDKRPVSRSPDAELSTKTEFRLETGLKFRADVAHSPFKFLTKVTDFWGVRVGIKNLGFYDIDRFGYVLEIGAGTW